MRLIGLSMQRVLLSLALLLAGTSPAASSSSREVDRTITWEEEVVLNSGHTMLVERTITVTRFSWQDRFRNERLTRRTIAFVWQGKRVEWVNDDRWPIYYMPDILEIVDDEPVVFMPVYRWGPCNKYGFPQEGFVAFRLRNGHWSPVSAREFPQGLKVNLLRNTHWLQISSDDKATGISPHEKLRLEQSSGGPKQGTTLNNASKFYADKEESCARIRPRPDPLLEQARQRNADAERDAITIQAEIITIDNKPAVVTKEMYAAVAGNWRRVGYLADNCRGIVSDIEPLEHWKDDGSMQLVGYTLLLAAGDNKRKVQVPGPSSLQRVVCDRTTIFVIKRQDKDNLVIHRFGHEGDLVDAVRVVLVDTAQILPGRGWGMLWTAVPAADDNLAISIVDYSSSTYIATHGGTVKRKVTYGIRLPPR